jgi:hypothetical protein
MRANEAKAKRILTPPLPPSLSLVLHLVRMSRWQFTSMLEKTVQFEKISKQKRSLGQGGKIDFKVLN